MRRQSQSIKIFFSFSLFRHRAWGVPSSYTKNGAKCDANVAMFYAVRLLLLCLGLLPRRFSNFIYTQTEGGNDPAHFMFIQILLQRFAWLQLLQLTQLLALLPLGECSKSLAVGQSPFLFFTRRFWNLLIEIFIKNELEGRAGGERLTKFSLASRRASNVLQSRFDGDESGIGWRRIPARVPRAECLRRPCEFVCSMSLSRSGLGWVKEC